MIVARCLNMIVASCLVRNVNINTRSLPPLACGDNIKDLILDFSM